MPATKNKSKPSATVPITDRSGDEDTCGARPKTSIRIINNGKLLEIKHPDGTLEHWPMVRKPDNTEVGLEGKMRCGDGRGFDKSHSFYLDMRGQLRLCVSATLGHDFAVDWASVSIENKHDVISATKIAYPYLFRFVSNWGVEAMFKKVLRNARDTKKNKQGRRKGGNKARARRSSSRGAHKDAKDNNDIVEIPPPKQRPTTKSNDKPTCHEP